MGAFSVCSYYIPGTVWDPQRVSILVKDKGATHSTRRSAVAKQLPWNLMVEEDCSNLHRERWPLGSTGNLEE